MSTVVIVLEILLCAMWALCGFIYYITHNTVVEVGSTWENKSNKLLYTVVDSDEHSVAITRHTGTDKFIYNKFSFLENFKKCDTKLILE